MKKGGTVLLICNNLFQFLTRFGGTRRAGRLAGAEQQTKRVFSQKPLGEKGLETRSRIGTAPTGCLSLSWDIIVGREVTGDVGRGRQCLTVTAVGWAGIPRLLPTDL